jgi:hypothetical protein
MHHVTGRPGRSRRGRSTFAATMLLAAGVAGCVRSQPIVLSPRPSIEPGEELAFRVRDTTVRLWAVRFVTDSVTGIPEGLSRSCLSCRVGFSLADVSQPRVIRPASATFWTVLPLAVLAGLMYEIYHVKTKPPPTNN